MASVSQKYVLVGPHTGKTLSVNGHEFVDGEFTFHGSAEQVSNLTRVFGNYAAIPAEAAELILAKQALAERDRLEKLGQLPQQPQDPASGEPAKVGGSNDTPAPVVPGKPSLAEAIGQLSWEQEAHWTSNNLPSVELLGELTGRKVSRADVEAVAAGYTRAKAKTLAITQ
jgi:hypothetical protein